MIDALVSRLPRGAVLLEKRVVAIDLNRSDRTWTVVTQDHKQLGADAVILTTPAYTAAELLAQVSGELSLRLGAVPYTSTTTVNLAYRREQIPHPLDAFGFIVPAIEKRSITACTFSSVKYPGRAPDGFALLRAFVGGTLHSSQRDLNDDATEATVRGELSDLLGIETRPLLCHIHRYPRSMPQYRVGHLDLVERIEACLRDLPNLALAGSAYRGVGIPDCIHSGEEAAEKIVNQLQKN
jgi:oxygen-dependent protoporphyrinogen oxidase